MAEETEVKGTKAPLIIGMYLISLLVAFYFLIPDFHDFVNESYTILTSGDDARVKEWVQQIGVWGPIVILLGMTLQMFLIVIPSWLLMLVSILAYGSFWGILLILVSIFVASSVGYFIGRFLSPVAVELLIGSKKQEQLKFYADNYGFWVVVITRLSPLFSNDAISFVGGLLRMGYWKFMGATMAGIIPLSLLFAYFGRDTHRLKPGLIWVSIISLIGFIAYVIFDRKKRAAEAS